MDTDIYIEEKTGGRSMRIPWIPESITFDSNGTRFAKYEILKVGEVYIPSGAHIHSYAWKSLLPGEGTRDDILQRGEWQDPLRYQQIWSAWRDYGTPLHLLVTGTPITVLSSIGGNVIVNVKDSRVAINEDMARHIMI